MTVIFLHIPSLIFPSHIYVPYYTFHLPPDTYMLSCDWFCDFFPLNLVIFKDTPTTTATAVATAT